MKKIISIIIMLSMLLGVVAFPAGALDDTSQSVQKAEILMELDILSGYDAKNYEPLSKVKKYEFVNFIYNMLGDFDCGKNFNKDAATYLEGIGIIDSAENINSSGGITVSEASKMLVTALGYGGAAKYSGGYPTGYLSYANKLSLLDGVSVGANEELKMFDAVTMLYNAIECNAAIPVGVSGESIDYKVSDNVTILSYYRNIYKIEGRVTANYYTTLWDAGSISENEIEIDFVAYDIGKTNASELFGYSVIAYVKQGRDDAKGTIMSISKNPRKNKELIISSNDIQDVSDDGREILYYTDTGKSKNVNIVNPKVVYNGQIFNDYNKETFMPEKGQLKIVDSDGDNSYDIIFVENIETILVDSVNTSTKKIYNKLLYPGSISEMILELDGGEGTIDIRNGKTKLELSEVKEWDVLSVKRSMGNERPYISVEVCVDRVIDKIQSININHKEIKVNNKTYALSEAFLKAYNAGVLEAQIIVGEKYEIFLNSDNEVVGVKKETDSETKFGYAMQVVKTDSLTPEVAISIFTEEQEWVILNFADKLAYNGDKKKDRADVYNKIIALGDFEPQLVQYRLNKDNEIVLLETAVEDDGDYTSGRLRKKSSNGVYRYNDLSFDSKYYLNNATYWIVPDEEYKFEKSAYMITRDRFHIQKDEYYDFIVYNLDEYNFSNQVVIVSETSTSKPTGRFFTVSEVSYGLNSSGEMVQTIYGAYKNYDKIMLTAEDTGQFDNINPGDILTVNPNSAGVLPEQNGFEIQYSIKDGEVYYTGDIYTKFARMSAKVEKIDPTEGRMKLFNGSGTIIRRCVDMPSVVIYNDRTNIIERGELSDIQQDDFIVYREAWASISDIVVIRK